MDTLYDLLWVGSVAPLLVAVLLRRSAPPGSLLVAFAFAVSFPWDFTAGLAGGLWEMGYLWLPLQMGLAIAALLWTKEALLAWATVLGLGLSWDVLVQGTGPDVVVTAAGMVGVITLASLRPHPLRWPLLGYFGLGSALYLVMGAQIGAGGFMGWWWAYQSARVLAWVTFAGVLVHSWRASVKLRREVRDRMVLMFGEVATDAA